MGRIYSAVESDEFVSVSYVARRPRRRDFLKVLFGRYTPVVERSSSLTAKGIARELKEAWGADALAAQFLESNPLMALLDERAEPDDLI